MKFTKPKPLADPRADDRAILNFLDSLPDAIAARALRLLAAAEANDGNCPETEAAMCRYTGGEPVTFPKGLSAVVPYSFAANLERERNGLAARVAELEKDAERLEWLMRNMTGRSLRECVGELADTGDIAEFRAAIDAARSKP